MEKKHTELPWTLLESEDEDDYAIIKIDGMPGTTFIAKEIKQGYDDGKSDAEFIIKACNNHYALLEALKGLLDAANVPPGKQVEDGYAKLTKALRNGFDVIKNCEK